MESLERQAIAEYFAERWMMITQNSDELTERLHRDAKDLDEIQLSELLRDEWETLAEQVCELVEERISDTAGLYIREILQGWGSYPFDLIAEQVKENN